MTDIISCPVAHEREVRQFPFDRPGCPMEPSGTYAELRETEPISKISLRLNGREAWLLTRFEDIRTMLSDSRFSADMTNPGYPLQFEFPMELIGKVKPALLHMDPPEHTKNRMMLMPELTVKKVETLRPRTQEVVDECIDNILELGKDGTPVDLVEHLAMPVPAIGMAEMMNIAHEEKELFTRWVTLLVTQGDGDEHADLNMQVEMLLYKLMAERSENPGDDLMSSLVQRNKKAGETLEPAEVSALVRAMIAAGHESTVNGIAIGVMVLLNHPEQAQFLRDNPEYSGRAVDEILRYSSISDHGTVRVATEDVVLAGQLIKAGEGVVCSLSAGNHDPAVYENPNTLDLTRKEARHSLAFGYGRHMCAGQTLVRMQLETVFTTLLRRIPTIRQAVPLEELPFKSFYKALIDGLHALPVTW
jgi:cytochrome P450